MKMPPHNYAAALRVFVPVLKLMGPENEAAADLFEDIAAELDAAREALGAREGESLVDAAKRCDHAPRD